MQKPQFGTYDFNCHDQFSHGMTLGMQQNRHRHAFNPCRKNVSIYFIVGSFGQLILCKYPLYFLGLIRQPCFLYLACWKAKLPEICKLYLFKSPYKLPRTINYLDFCGFKRQRNFEMPSILLHLVSLVLLRLPCANLCHRNRPKICFRYQAYHLVMEIDAVFPRQPTYVEILPALILIPKRFKRCLFLFFYVVVLI